MHTLVSSSVSFLNLTFKNYPAVIIQDGNISYFF
jgi:hypothetical protein